MNPAGVHPLALWSLSLAYFMLGTASIAVVGLVHPMSADLSVSKPAIASLVTVFALTFALAAPLVQVAAGRLPRRSLLLGGLATLAAGCLGSAWAPDYPTLVAARVLMALGACAVGPVASSLGAGLVPADRQGHALSVVFGGMTIATVLGLPLVTALSRVWGWRAMFAGLAAASLLVALAIALLVRDRRPSAPVTLASFAQVFARPAATWAIAMAMGYMAAQFAMYALVAVYLQDRFGVPAPALPLAFLLAGVSSVIGNLAAGRMGDRLGASRTLAITVTALAGTFLVVPALPPGAAIGMAAFAGWSLIGMAFYAPQQKRLIALAPDLRNLLLAMNASALYIGMSLGSAAAAQVARTAGVRWLPLLAVAFLCLTLAAFARSRRAERRTGVDPGAAAGAAAHPPPGSDDR